MKNVVKNVVDIQNTKKKKNKRIAKFFIILVIFLVILTSGFVVVFSSSDSENEILDGKSLDDMSLTTFIYDKDGVKIDEIHGLENRIHVKYENIPKNLVNSIISIEDERFFKHKGIDLKRTIGAIFNYIFNRDENAYGGSTITQQLVKNVTNDNDTSISRKIREWKRAYSIEKKYSKEYIFEAYANTIYFGEGAYGIEVAARTYFDKSVKELSLGECATIAAAIQSPETTNPYLNEESKQKLLQRKNIVLDKMLELNKITEAEYSLAKEENINFKRGKTGNSIKSYFVEAAIEQVVSDLQKEKNMTEEEAKKLVYTSGYKIYTTMDKDVQTSIDNAYSNSQIFYTESNGDFMQSAMVVIEQSSGNVVGLIGGADKKQGNYVLNRATQSYRQPGSCMKPIGAYGPAFEQEKLTPNSIIEDNPINVNGWSPKNYYNYLQAIAMSMNLPAVRANMKVDKSYAYDFAKGCGLKSLQEADRDIAPLALGGLTKGVTPLEMASAYATIANGGDYIEPAFYTKVLDRNGKQVLYKNYLPTRAMSKNTAAMLTTCLLDVTSYGTGAGIITAPNGIAIAGKTGNTNDDKDQWFCGFTPYYTIACWNGYDLPRAIGYRTYGSYPYTSMILFNNVMNEICKYKEAKQFDLTSDMFEEIDVCTISHLLPNNGCYINGCVEKKIVTPLNKPTSYCMVHNNVSYNNNDF